MSRIFPISIFVICFLFLIFSKNSIEKKLSPYIKRGPSLFEKNARYHANSLKKYNLGFGLVIADLLWIRLLQNARHTEIEQGKVSWEFTQVDAITTLDPKFRVAYEFGSIFLSVFLRDKLGAKIILEKWVNNFPNYWRSHYLLGYHLFYEMKNYAAAVPHIFAAARRSGAPSWLNSLGIRLFSQTVGLTQALSLSLSLLQHVSDSEGKDRLYRRIRSLRYNIELRLWEDALKKYRITHKKEPQDIMELLPYKKGEERELASIFENITVPEEIYGILNEKFRFMYNNSKKSIEPVGNVSDDIKRYGLNENG